MQWIITQDLLETVDHLNIVGYGSVGREVMEAYLVKQREVPKKWHGPFCRGYFLGMLPYEFRLLDGDDEVYYQGSCSDIADADQDQAFEPLDFAATHAGCTSMEYRLKNETKWIAL